MPATGFVACELETGAVILSVAERLCVHLIIAVNKGDQFAETERGRSSAMVEPDEKGSDAEYGCIGHRHHVWGADPASDE